MAASAKQIDNLVSLIDGYAEEGGYHLNVNVLVRIHYLMLSSIQKSIHSLQSVYQDTL